MEEKFMRLIAGQEFMIEPIWGYHQLMHVHAMAEMSANEPGFFAQMREKSQVVDFFNGGTLVTGSTYDDLPAGSIARVSLSGVMTVEDGLCHYGLKSFDNTMRMLYANDSVKGIILRLDTGGGQAAAGNIMFNTLSDRNKPVISLYTLMASAGVLGALPSDEIIAESTMSRAGSIGVVMQFPKWYANADDERNDHMEVYSDESPRKNEVWRALEMGDTSKMVKMLTRLDRLFMEQVRSSRTLRGGEATQNETLSGAMFDARQARSRGLIDGIGSMNYALKRMKSVLKYSNF